jgi:hypothetical protein
MARARNLRLMRVRLLLYAAVAAAVLAVPPSIAAGPPDLQGVWTSGTLTPFERPVALGTKAFYTEEEAREFEKARAERRANPTRTAGDVGSDNEAFVDSGYTLLANRQTSLVVDPPDGRVPIRPEAEKRRDFNLANRDDFETMSPWDRCITRGPLLLLPTGYNNGIRIVQTPGYVAIEAEMIHEARIVPLNGSPHVSSNARSWTGDPRGHWEGATLVVDSANYLDRGWISTHAASGRLRGLPNSAALHIVERFTLKDANTLEWRMTVEDPAVFSAPWTVVSLFTRSPEYQMYEYACHEGNQATELVLRGARAEERDGRTGR